MPIQGHLPVAKMFLSARAEKKVFQILLAGCLLFPVLLGAYPPTAFGQETICSCTGSWLQTDHSELLSVVPRFHPVVATGTNDIVVAGNTVQYPWFLNHPFHVQRVDRYADSLAGRVISQTRGNLGPPSGDFVFAFPQVAVDVKGTVHMVWAEPNPNSLEALRNRSQPLSRPSFTQVYYAAYRNGVWTTPNRIYQERLYWGAQNSPTFTIDADGALHLAFPTLTTETRVAYLRRDTESWENRSPEIARPAPYVSLVTDADERLHLAYVSTPAAGGRTTQLLYRHSDDKGQTWSEPVLTNSEQTKQAGRPILLEGPSGTLHLLWVTDADTSTYREVVWHTRSASQDFSSWTNPVRAVGSREGMFSHLQASFDKCGVLHVVARTTTGPETALYYTHWNSATWSDPMTPFSDIFHFGGDLFTGPDGDIHLIWSSSNRPQWGEEVTLRSAVRPSCRDR